VRTNHRSDFLIFSDLIDSGTEIFMKQAVTTVGTNFFGNGKTEREAPMMIASQTTSQRPTRLLAF
jgi:hypothetical protein